MAKSTESLKNNQSCNFATEISFHKGLLMWSDDETRSQWRRPGNFFPSCLSLSYIPKYLSTRIKNGSCLTETRCGWTIHRQKKSVKKILDYWCKREKGGGIPFNLSPMDFISSVCVVGSAKTSNEVELLRALSPTNSRYCCCCCCTHRVGTKKNSLQFVSSENPK